MQVTGFLHSIRDAAKQLIEQTKNSVVTSKENVPEQPANNSNKSGLNNPIESGDPPAVIFPLWYVGRVIVSHRQAPPTLIDDLVERFNKCKGMNELEKELNGQKKEQKESGSNTISHMEDHSNRHQVVKKAQSFDGNKIIGGTNEENPSEVGKHGTLLRVDSTAGRPRSASDGDKSNKIYSSSKDNNSVRSQHHSKTHSRHSSFGGVKEDRNILFKISIFSITCLSTGSKMQLMEKRLREVSFCQQVTCGSFCLALI